MEFYTIGVYGSTEQSFFTKLKENGIDTFAIFDNGEELEVKNTHM